MLMNPFSLVKPSNWTLWKDFQSIGVYVVFDYLSNMPQYDFIQERPSLSSHAPAGALVVSRRSWHSAEMMPETGILIGENDSVERRRIQNRLHQKAWRRRRKLQRQQEAHISSQLGPGILVFSINQQPEEQSYRSAHNDAEDRTPSIPDWCSLYTDSAKRTRALVLYQSAYEDYSLKAPRPANLPTLIRLNLLRAITRNSHHIGIPPDRLCRDEFVSPFNRAGPRRKDDIFSSCPVSLQPSMTQQRVVHHPWIDLLPFPQVRDNVLLGMEAGIVDDDELSEDLMEFGSGDADLVRRPALIVWGEASEYRSWEVNTAFLKKWGHLLRGCPELVVSTNIWRSKRGEGPLLFDV